MRSAPDGSFRNNWSTRGNTNPYTGVFGTKATPPSNHYYASPVNYYSKPTYAPQQAIPPVTLTPKTPSYIPATSMMTVPSPPVIPKHTVPYFDRTGWACIPGYVQSGDQCMPVVEVVTQAIGPATCAAGKVFDGASCQPIQLPRNARVADAGDWARLPGFVNRRRNSATFSSVEKSLGSDAVSAAARGGSPRHSMPFCSSSAMRRAFSSCRAVR
jgi:hypothetical protein